MAVLTLRFPDHLKEKLEAVSEELGLSLNALVTIGIDEYLRKRSVKAPVRSSTVKVDSGRVDSLKNISRNAPCPCGSGKKYKRCHGNEKTT